MSIDTKLREASAAVRVARGQARFTVGPPERATRRRSTPALVLMTGLAVLVAVGVPLLLITSGSEQTPVDSSAPVPAVAATAPPTTATTTTEAAAHTGRYGTGGEDGTGEMIRLDAPDAPAVILQLAADIELPPGGTFDQVIDNLPDEPTEQSESGIMTTLEFHAGCLWTGYWLDSVAAGDTAAQAEAQAVLDEIPTWPALSASDGGGVIDAWNRNARLAAAGDVQGVLDNLYTNNCTDVVPGR